MLIKKSIPTEYNCLATNIFYNQTDEISIWWLSENAFLCASL